MRWPTAAILACLCARLVAPGASAEPPLKLGTNAGKELAEAQALLTAGKAAEAADKLRRLTADAGDDLVTLDGRHYRPLARAAQALVLSLPADELRAWRGRVDPPALKLLDEGRASRDPRPLRELVFRHFASSHTEDALLLLAELAAERGDHRSAETYLRRLLPDADPTADPSVPAVKTSEATVRGRVALAMIFDRHPGAAAAVTDVRTKYPTAAGRLAGRDGPYADTLETLLREPPATAVAPLPTGDWETLGGDAGRAGRPASATPRYWPARPTWHADFPAADGRRRLPYLPPLGSTRTVALHPVTLGDTGYVADGSRVFGFDLKTGETRYTYDLASERDAVTPPGGDGLPTPHDCDFVLTAAGGRLYARLGDTAIDPLPQTNGRVTTASFLTCFGPRVVGGAISVLWKLRPPVPDKVAAAWEAAPAVVGNKLYAAFARESAGGLVVEIACYAALDTTPERPLWVTPVADLRPAETVKRRRAEAVTVAGGVVAYCTHAGSVVALDAETGRVRWAYQYPRLAKPSAAYRDMNPPIVHAGRVFVAPTDADRVLCLDAAGGQLLWEAGGLLTDQFLGVAAGNLVAAVAGPVRGLRGFDVTTGADRGGRGWKIHDDPLLRSWGRGLVTEDVALWPTKAGVFFVRPADGLPLGGRLPGPQGNLAYADGVLLVGTPTGVTGYVANPGPRPPADRAEEVLRGGRRDEARAIWAGILSDETVSPDGRARVAARLASLDPPGQAAMTVFLGRYPAAAKLGGDFVLAADGRPVTLARHLAGHFGTPPPDAAQSPPPARTGGHDPAPPATLDPAASLTTWPAGPPSSHPLVTPDGDLAEAGGQRLLFAEPGRICAYTVETGELAASVPVRHTVTTAITDPAHSVTCFAGPDGVTAANLAPGRVIWELRLPDADPLPPAGVAAWLPSRVGSGVRPGFGPFHLTPTHLVALWADTHLVAVNRETGLIDWVRPAGDSPALAVPPGDGPRFSPAFWAGDRVVVADLTTGRRVTVSARTGAVLSRDPSAAVPWVGPPVTLADGRLAIPGDLGSVAVFDPSGGLASRGERPAWDWEPGGVASLTGRPTQLLAAGRGLLVAVSRNTGTEVKLLNAAGRTSNVRGVFLPPHTDLTHARRVERATYVPAGGRLYAIRDLDGDLAWPAADLAALTAWPRDAAWRVLPGVRSVLAYPELARPKLPLDLYATRLLREFARHPHAALLPAFGFALAAATLDCRLPLVFLDHETGRVLATRELAVGGPGVAVAASGNFLAVAAAGRVTLLKSP